MKNLASKILFGAVIAMMTTAVSCKGKDANETSGDMDTTTVVDPITPATSTPSTTPGDTTGMSTDTTTVTP